MPYSMTGFVSLKKNFQDYDIDIKVKSLNGKILELSLKGDKTVQNFLEIEIKKLAQQFFERGTISVVINVIYKKPVINIDPQKLKEMVNLFKEIFKESGLNTSDDKILDYSANYSSNNSEDLNPQLKEDIINSLTEAFEILKVERKKEGDSLIKDIEERLKLIEKYIEDIDSKKDELIKIAQDKMSQKVKQLLGEEFSERAFIEASLIAQKMDITEEIVRLKNHINRFLELLNIDEPVGRKMDFLCQEMHREINTLGNKMPDFSKLTIEIKSQIEKIRQQVQNIE
ncbi:MAG: DUF1732 domain-containing protein [Hydrogenothermaceae bacterium]|nr:DUF1732 domain-containing protein [Hydrogenothermaceae bacterium]